MTLREFLKLCPPNVAIFITDKTKRKFCYTTMDDNFASYLDCKVTGFGIDRYGCDIVIVVEE